MVRLRSLSGNPSFRPDYPALIQELIYRVRRSRGETHAQLAAAINAIRGTTVSTGEVVAAWEDGHGGPPPGDVVMVIQGMAGGELAALVDEVMAAGSSDPGRGLDREWTSKSNEDLMTAAFGEDGASRLTAGTALRLAHEWLVTDPPQVVELRSGRRIGPRLVRQVEDRIHQLRQMDDFLGGGDMHKLVEHELRATLHLLKEASYSERLGRRLLAAIGEMCQVAGWVTSDAGHHQEAERYYLAGFRAAHAAGNLPLAGNLISSLSYQVANAGDPREALLLARTAYRGAKDTASAATRALLLERVAWASARSGEIESCEQSLAAVDDAFELKNPDEDPIWVYWLDRSEIDIMAGRCFTELERPLRAEPLLRRAIAGYDESRAREVALYLSWLAEAYLQAREVEQAGATAMKMLELASTTTSARSMERVKLLHRKLDPFGQVTEVREFNERFREMESSR